MNINWSSKKTQVNLSPLAVLRLETGGVQLDGLKDHERTHKFSPEHCFLSAMNIMGESITQCLAGHEQKWKECSKIGNMFNRLHFMNCTYFWEGRCCSVFLHTEGKRW